MRSSMRFLKALPKVLSGFSNRLVYGVISLVLLLSGTLFITPPTPVQANTGGYGTVNLAKNQPVTALTNTVTGSPEMINDGDLDSVWFSYQDYPCQNSFILDLGSSFSIGRIDIKPAQAHGFTISTSDDGITYTERYSSPWINTSVTYVPVSIPVTGLWTARYIKYWSYADWLQYVGVYEIEVYEWLASPPPPPTGACDTANLALNKPVTNIWGSIVPSNPPSYAVDGNPGTIWLGDHNAGRPDDKWGKWSIWGNIMIDLGDQYTIGSISITPKNLQAYQVIMSETNPYPADSPWVFMSYPVLFGTNNTISENHTFMLNGSVTARYIWLVTMNSPDIANYLQPGIAEIEVYKWITESPPVGIITTVAGNGNWSFGGDGGAAVDASLNAPHSIAADGAGNLYIADTFNHRIRRVDASGTITTIAGNGSPGFTGDGGPAAEASLNSPYCVAVDGAGNLYIADTNNHRIRKVDTSGTITTIAGNGSPGFAGDGGPAAAASLYNPYGVAIDRTGNLFIADTDNNRIRKVYTSGTITTVAGNGSSGFDGDGGPAVDASLSGPWNVAIDGSGNLYIADRNNNRIRKVDAFGTITTIAGNGSPEFTGDGGPAANAGLNSPWGVALDGADNLYIGELGNQRIRKVDASGIITTVAGNGIPGFAGDGGPATDASLQNPTGVSIDGAGNLYIADSANSRIRKVDGIAVPVVWPVLNPDLTISEKHEEWVNPDNHAEGYRVLFTVKNIGAGIAHSGIGQELTGIDVGMTRNGIPIPVEKHVTLPGALNPGDTYEGFFDVIFPAPAGTWNDEISVTVDVNQECIESNEANNMRVNLWPLYTMTYIGMNVNTAPFTDARVRQAVYLAMDRDTIDDIIAGSVKVQSIVAPPVSNPNLNLAYNPNLAKSLLAEAGYPNGFNCELYIPSTFSTDVAIAIKGYLAVIDIDATITALDPAIFMSRYFAHNMGFFITGTGVWWAHPESILGRLLVSTSPSNATQYNNSAFDSQFGSGAFTDAENTAFGTINGLPIVPLYWSINPPAAVAVVVNAPSKVSTDQYFSVPIEISTVSELNAVQFDITFKNTVLQWQTPSNGSIGGAEVTVLFNQITSPAPPEGYSTYRFVISFDLGTVSGSGTLAVLNFHPTGQIGDTSEIIISRGILSGLSGPIMANWISDAVQISVIPGDANDDGVINVLDMTSVARIILQLDTGTPGADANLDGLINVLDMTRIARIILGLE